MYNDQSSPAAELLQIDLHSTEYKVWSTAVGAARQWIALVYRSQTSESGGDEECKTRPLVTVS